MENILDLLMKADELALFWDNFNKLGVDCQTLLRMDFDSQTEDEIMHALRFGNQGSVRVKRFKCKEHLKKMMMTDARWNELKP